MTDRTKTGEPTPPSDLIERMARAMYECDGGSSYEFGREMTTVRAAYLAAAQAAYAVVRERIEELELALEPLALLARDVNMNDPLHKWFRVGHLYAAQDALKQRIDP